MNISDYGGYIRIGVGEDLSSASSFALNFIAPSGATSAKSGVLGVVPVNGMLAGQYVDYQVEQGFLAEAGAWKVKLLVQYPSGQRSTDLILFTINP